MREGIYAGQGGKSPVIEYGDSKSTLSKFKDKFKYEFKSLERKMDRKIEKEWAKRIAEEEHFRNLEEVRGRKSAVQLRHRPKQMNLSDFGYKRKWIGDVFP